VLAAGELASKADRLRKHEDKDFNKSKPLLKAMPVFLIRPIVWLTGYLSSSLGLNIPALGVKYCLLSAARLSVCMCGWWHTHPICVWCVWRAAELICAARA
jgi:hypothetical protein